MFCLFVCTAILFLVHSLIGDYTLLSYAIQWSIILGRGFWVISYIPVQDFFSFDSGDSNRVLFFRLCIASMSHSACIWNSRMCFCFLFWWFLFFLWVITGSEPGLLGLEIRIMVSENKLPSLDWWGTWPKLCLLAKIPALRDSLSETESVSVPYRFSIVVSHKVF